LDPYGWHTGNAAGNDPPVGAVKPNAWGLYDMHGYLWEFCSDRWTKEADPAKATATTSDLQATESIVIRGGSWKDRFESLVSRARRAFGNEQRDDAVGCRCVRAKVSSP